MVSRSSSQTKEMGEGRNASPAFLSVSTHHPICHDLHNPPKRVFSFYCLFDLKCKW